MRTEVVEQRVVAALREAGGDAGELQRRAEELLAERCPAARVVDGAAVGRLVTERLVQVAVVEETGGGDGPVADEVISCVALFHDEREGVALLEREEVDVPLED